MTTNNPGGLASLRPLLLRIGLEEREVEVYLALASLKQAKASAVARTARQTRSHTYIILRSLEAKGLVSEVDRGRVLEFIAEPPERLLAFVQEKSREYKALEPVVAGALPLLAAMSRPLEGRPHVTLLQGMDGMREVYRDALAGEICGFFNPASMYEAFGENIVTKLFGKEAQLRGRDLIVDGPEARRYVEEVPANEHYDVRLLPAHVQFSTDTIVYGDRIALFAFDSTQTIIRMENKKLADTFRSWFEAMWSVSEKP